MFCPVSLILAVFGGNPVKFKKLKYSARDVCDEAFMRALSI